MSTARRSALCLAGAGPAIALALTGCSAGTGSAPRASGDAWAGVRAAASAPAGTAQPAQPAEAGPVRAVEPWSFGDSAGRVIRTDHFNIHTTVYSAVVAGRLPGFLESALDHYTTALVNLPQPSARLDTFVMGSRREWVNLTLRDLGERGRTLLQIQRGGFALDGRAYLFDIGAADTLAIAAHEGWHQYTQRTFQERLPLWAEEGIATYMEGHRWAGARVEFAPWSNTERFDRLREAAAAGQLLPLEDLLSGTTAKVLSGGGEAATAYYAQVWALIHFLNEGAGGAYRPALHRLITDAATGRLGAAVVLGTRQREGDHRSSSLLIARGYGPQVFRVYFGKDPAAVEAEFRAFIRQTVSTGSRQAVNDGRSPIGGPARGPKATRDVAGVSAD